MMSVYDFASNSVFMSMSGPNKNRDFRDMLIQLELGCGEFSTEEMTEAYEYFNRSCQGNADHVLPHLFLVSAALCFLAPDLEEFILTEVLDTFLATGEDSADGFLAFVDYWLSDRGKAECRTSYSAYFWMRGLRDREEEIDAILKKRIEEIAQDKMDDSM